MLRALDRLADLETEKRQLPTGSPRFVELAEQVENLAVEILRRTERQRDLAETTGERREAGGGTGRPISEIPETPRELSAILRDWRDAERGLADADPATPAAA